MHGFPQRTIFDSLNENDLAFGIYCQNIPATLFFECLRKVKNAVKFHSLQFEVQEAREEALRR
ncbi:Phospholipase C 3 [Sesbania bispinosa]|nr:Phospholipase C 3 [Sesbania bispinosa]